MLNGKNDEIEAIVEVPNYAPILFVNGSGKESAFAITLLGTGDSPYRRIDEQTVRAP